VLGLLVYAIGLNTYQEETGREKPILKRVVETLGKGDKNLPGKNELYFVVNANGRGQKGGCKCSGGNWGKRKNGKINR